MCGGMQQPLSLQPLDLTGLALDPVEAYYRSDAEPVVLRVAANRIRGSDLGMAVTDPRDPFTQVGRDLVIGSHGEAGSSLGAYYDLFRPSNCAEFLDLSPSSRISSKPPTAACWPLDPAAGQIDSSTRISWAKYVQSKESRQAGRELDPDEHGYRSFGPVSPSLQSLEVGCFVDILDSPGGGSDRRKW